MQDWIKKFLAVFFLTLLVWAWAFLSLAIPHTWMVTLKTSPAATADYWVTFNGGQEQVDNLKLTLRGSPDKISDLVQRYRSEKLDFFYDPKEFGHDAGGKFKLDMTEYFRTHPKMEEYTLTFESCSPDKIDVEVEKLVPKLLVVQCVDENSAVVKHEAIEPAQVEINVRKDYTGPAYVMLTAQQMERARRLPVSERPYVELAPGKRKYAEKPINMTLPASEPLKEQVIQPMIGYIASLTLMNKYRIELVNETELKTIRNIRATDKAFDAYKKQRYHILVEVRDGDETLSEIPLRPVIYNFPPEFLKTGQIEAPNPPQQVQIRLVPLTTPATPTNTILPPS
jgi:hypothetical protein